MFYRSFPHSFLAFRAAITLVISLSISQPK
jgi:hypothetical protein